MRKYNAYKPSGIEWIGDVPVEWKKCRFKNFLKLMSDIAVGGIKIGLENIESGSGKFLATNGEFEGNGVTFDIGDVVYGKLRPYLMKVWVAEFKGNAVGDFFVFRTQQNADSNFVKYLMLSDGFTKETNGAVEGAKMPRVPSDFIMTLRYYLPPKDEQVAIASYLDAKCAKIDNVLAVQQKRIDLLKELKQSIITNAVTKGLDKNVEFKPSGIEWIGDVPEHWVISRVKNLCTIHGRIGYRGYTVADLVQDEDDGAITLSPTNIIDGKLDFSDCTYLSWEKYYESPEIMVKVGDLVFVKTASVGKSALVEYLPKETTVNPQIVVFKNIKCNGKFLDYFFKTVGIQSEVALSSNGSTISTISQGAIGAYKISLPPTEEQVAIAAYLDSKCSAIDNQISKIERQIELLKEYKQSIITECVTGKRKVC